MAEMEVDPITLQVIGGALHTVAKEMGHVLYRMSYSSIIRESEDLGAGLFDADCNTLCESDSTPMHIGSIPAYLRGIAETLHDPWQPGDVVIHNHPYYGASHSPDIAAVAPVFYEGELVGFSANTAHHVDIGAAAPGLIIDVPDVFAEGMLFKGVKLYEGGVRNRALWQFIATNTRVPDQVLGDIEAQVASVELGVKRFIELLDTYGKETVFAASHQLMDYSESMLRKQIALIPDGEYRAEGFLDDDGRNRGQTLPVKVCVRIDGDSAEVDLTGSAAQVPTAFNVPFEGSTKVACYFAFRAMLLDSAVISEHVPQNEGSFRPIKVTAPKGSIFNPIYPAAAEARFNQIQRVVDCIIKALAPNARMPFAIPHKRDRILAVQNYLLTSGKKLSTADREALAGLPVFLDDAQVPRPLSSLVQTADERLRGLYAGTKLRAFLDAQSSSMKLARALGLVARITECTVETLIRDIAKGFAEEGDSVLTEDDESTAEVLQFLSDKSGGIPASAMEKLMGLPLFPDESGAYGTVKSPQASAAKAGMYTVQPELRRVLGAIGYQLLAAETQEALKSLLSDMSHQK